MKPIILLIVALLSACADPAPMSGEFDPVFEDAARATPPLDVPFASGFYERTGDEVFVSVDIEWQNADPNLIDWPMRLRVPFEPANLREVEGYVAIDAASAVFIRADNREPVEVSGPLKVGFDQVSGALMIQTVDLAPGDVPVVLAYGTTQQRALISFTYQTVGQ
jgi:hypothetical protein